MRKSIVATLSASILVCGAVASAESARDVLHDARADAQRAAELESALTALETDGGANRDARTTARDVAEAARSFRPVQLPGSATQWVSAGLDLEKAERVGDALVQELADGTRVTFTVDPQIQDKLEKMLDARNVAHGGVVLIDPPTGRVLAMVSHTEHDTPIDGIALKSTAPSASVFKVITAAALLETAGHDPAKKVCYHGGRSGLTETNIRGDKRRDHKCATLEAALAWSINSIMAKLAYHQLETDDLRIWAERFGYNAEIPFELPVEKSTAQFVEDRFETARAAAGFWHTYLSPLHGAMIGAALANDGLMMQPSIIERVETAQGKVVQEFEPVLFRRVMAPETARMLGHFMEKTATNGTARKFFRGRGFPGDVTVSGKTGTLSNKDPYLGFTWFVGYGEQDGHKVGVSGLACNTPLWQIKGGHAAAEALKLYFGRPRPKELASR